MTYDDILDLLIRLWEYMDQRADGDQDGPNNEARYCAELDTAINALMDKDLKMPEASQ